MSDTASIWTRRGRPRQARCARGHPLVEGNLYRPPSAPHKRECLRCKEDRGAPIGRKRMKRCVHGHLFDEANTYWTKRGTRTCRKCQAQAQKKYRQRRLTST